MNENRTRHHPDDHARRLARRLVRAGGQAALAALEPGTGAPLASRVLVATDFAGDPVILVSALSAHSGALLADPRASLLFGEPGSGDPLAHPRITVAAQASPVEPGSEDHARVRARFLARHPYAQVYVDFPDFRFLRLLVERAALNGGFARAFDLERADVTDPGDAAIEAAASRALAHMNEDHAEAIERIARRSGLPRSERSRRIATGDARGFEMIGSGRIERVEFTAPVTTPGGFRSAYVALLAEPELP